MDEHNPQSTAGSIRPDATTPDGRDLLISRIIDARAGAEDWLAFRQAAEHDPAIWRELAEAQRAHELMCEGLSAATACADRVDLPEFVTDGSVLQRRLDGLSRWGGWAAAAALLLVWATGAPVLRSGTQTAGLIPSATPLNEATPDQAMDRYLNAGRTAGLVIGEMPDRVIVETIRRDDGSVEVVYLRQIIERRVTDRVYREVLDETGRLVPVAIPVSEIQTVRTY